MTVLNTVSRAQILNGFKQMSGDQWEEQKAHFPPMIVQRLQSRYGL